MLRVGQPSAPERAQRVRGTGALVRSLARSLALAALLASGLVVAVSLARSMPGAPGSSTSSTSSTTLCACGLGNTVTMIANNAPALAYAPPNDDTDAPAGIFALDYYIHAPVAFHEDLSRLPNAPDPNTLQWQWDFGDGSPLVNQAQATHTFTTPGTYTVKVSVYEPVSGQWGLFDNAIMHVIAAPFSNPPVAQAHALTSTVIGVGGQISFDATGSHAADGSTATYSWNFGDNSVATGMKVTHLFKQAGRGFVTLTVSDARGAKSIAQVSVVIVETAQSASVSASATSAPVGAQVSFDASKTQPPVDQPVAVAWDFGDGSPLVTTTTPTVAHTYTKPGNYTVTVGVYGQLGDGGVSTVKVKIMPASGATTPASAQSGPNWLLLGGAILLALVALVGVVAFWLSQRRRAAAERQRRQAIELARARRVNAAQRRPPAGYGGPRDPRDPHERAFDTSHAGAPTRQQRQPYGPPSGDDRRR